MSFVTYIDWCVTGILRNLRTLMAPLPHRVEHEPFAHSVFAGFTNDMLVTRESDVAEVVLKAANDDSSQLCFPAGADALALV